MNRPRSAAFPWQDGRPPHLPAGPGDIAEGVLLPGDPDRVGLAAPLFESIRDFGRRREYRLITGRFSGTPVTLCSTGIGGPSTEIAAVELANLGARRLIRVGGMGALSADLPLGGFLIVGTATGATGAARLYRSSDAPIPASPSIVSALAGAAVALGVPHRLGTIATTDSYYLGQHRPIRGSEAAHPIDFAAMAEAGIDGFDMESETLFAVGHAMGVEVGAVLAVHGHRRIDSWLEDYEPTQRILMRLAATALALLAAKPSGGLDADRRGAPALLKGA